MKHGTTISVQKKLVEEIDKVIQERPELFYRNRTDFVADACRRLMRTILEGASQ